MTKLLLLLLLATAASCKTDAALARTVDATGGQIERRGEQVGETLDIFNAWLLTLLLPVGGAGYMMWRKRKAKRAAKAS